MALGELVLVEHDLLRGRGVAGPAPDEHGVLTAARSQLPVVPAPGRPGRGLVVVGQNGSQLGGQLGTQRLERSQSRSAVQSFSASRYAVSSGSSVSRIQAKSSATALAVQVADEADAVGPPAALLQGVARRPR